MSCDKLARGSSNHFSIGNFFQVSDQVSAVLCFLLPEGSNRHHGTDPADSIHFYRGLDEIRNHNLAPTKRRENLPHVLRLHHQSYPLSFPQAGRAELTSFAEPCRQWIHDLNSFVKIHCGTQEILSLPSR